MKKSYTAAIVFFLFLTSHVENSFGQCGAGYTQAQVNWDKLDYYFNATKPYNSYVTDAMEQTQKFAIGPNYVTIATSSNALVNPGTADGVTAENTTHTGDLANYTGADVQYNPSSNGQTITLTFNAEVTNLNFTLYDIDLSQRIDFSATNALSVAQTINVAVQASTILTITNNNTTAPYVTASATSLANSSNQGSATITVAGPVKQLVITVTTIGTDAVFWLSDINACVTGSFPSNYNRTPDNQPFTGPAGNQPDYFIITPDNNYAYMVDPATGKAWPLFQDASKTYMNSFAYDPYNHYLYYISENASLDANNKTLKRFDFNTETSSTVLADLTTLNIPTMNSGVESAGAAYYNGQLFIGFEGGQHNNSNTRESIVYRLDLNGSFIPVNAVQVFAVNSYNGSTGTHDWADFVIENGILFNYNSRSGTSMVSYEHFNMMTGASTQYLNPNTSSGYAYQAGLTWAGDQYSFSSGAISKYNENGTVGSPITITLASGGPFPGGSGDASENYRPKCDFGDAPASYDPDPISPAVHERFDSLRLGLTWDREWVKTSSVGATADGADEDGISTVPVLDTGTFNYAIDVDVYNNSGANATVSAWLDYNGNGVFDPSEGVTTTVSSSASMQTVTLVWWGINTSLNIGQTTYLRVRITSASKGMGTANPTGYYDVGEVEDYEVFVDRVLPVNLVMFDARSVDNSIAALEWKSENEINIGSYEIERSSDGRNWHKTGEVAGRNQNGIQSYSYTDSLPLQGKSYYRLRVLNRIDGRTEKYSSTKTVTIQPRLTAQVFPNPAMSIASVIINVSKSQTGTIALIDIRGVTLESFTLNLDKGRNDILLSNLTKYSPGNYIIKINTGEGELKKQLVIRQ